MNTKEEVIKKNYMCLKCKKKEIKAIKAKGKNVVRCITCGGLMNEANENSSTITSTTSNTQSLIKTTNNVNKNYKSNNKPNTSTVNTSSTTSKKTTKTVKRPINQTEINNNMFNVRQNIHFNSNNPQTRLNQRDRSLDFLPKSLGIQLRNPRQNPLGFLQDFFAGYGVDFPAEELMLETGLRPRPQHQPQLNLQVNMQNVASDIYDPQFTSLGSEFNDTFQENFSSNFRSNFEENVFNQLLSLIRGNRVLASQEKHPPTKRSVLMALKKFPLTDKYCKANINGEIELPNCCICICDIQKGENTVLLPCGHLLHWKCAFAWLKQNNRCPVCRFELPSQ